MLEKLGALGCTKQSILSVDAKPALADILGKVGNESRSARVITFAAIADTRLGIEFQVQLYGDNARSNNMIVGKCNQTRNVSFVIIAHSDNERSRKNIFQAAAFRHNRDAQYMCWPPLIDSVLPVMNPASSATRNTTPRAISLALPSRPTGMRATILASTSGGTAATMSVSI